MSSARDLHSRAASTRAHTAELVRLNPTHSPLQAQESHRIAKNQALIRRIEGIVDKVLDRYEQALDSGKVRPESFPLAIGILLTKRLELTAELGIGPSADQKLVPTSILAQLLSKPAPTIDLPATEPTKPEPLP